MVRADGQFLAEGVYIAASEIAAIMLDRDGEDELDTKKPNVGIHHEKKVQRLVS